MNEITKLLGSETEQQLRDGIKEIILETVRDDLNDYVKHNHFVNYIELIICEMCEEIKNEVKGVYEDKLKLAFEEKLKNF